MRTVSAVIPVHNGERYLREALDSALGQSRPADEVIVVDDGSTDGTPRLLEAYAGRVRVLRQANAGVAAARNRGLREAKGDFAAFLDADDRWLPGKLAAAAAALERHPAAVLAFSDMTVIEADGRRGRRVRRRPEGRDLFRSLLLGNTVTTSSAVVRREAALAAGGFREGMRCPAGAEDWDLFLRLARAGAAVYVGKSLVEYRRHAASAVQTRRFDLREDALDVVRLNAEGLPEPLARSALAGVYRESALRHLAAGDAREARRDLRRGLALEFRAGAAALWLASWAGSGAAGAFAAARRAWHRAFAPDPGDSPDVYFSAGT
jgi:glycosyltransferase involved in cell wall biosynthesis